MGGWPHGCLAKGFANQRYPEGSQIVRPSYNQIAGTSVERLAALSDGAFSIAMTLLVLDLRAPAVDAIKSEGDLWRGLTALLPRLLVYVMSFLTLGINGVFT